MTWEVAGPSIPSYRPLIEKYSKMSKLDPDLVEKMVMAESSGDPKRISPKGARGLMQLMPDTAKEMGVKDVHDPEQNIMGGTKYLAKQMKDFGGDTRKALIAYNGGSKNVNNPAAESVAYADKLMGKGGGKKWEVAGPRTPVISSKVVPGSKWGTGLPPVSKGSSLFNIKPSTVRAGYEMGGAVMGAKAGAIAGAEFLPELTPWSELGGALAGAGVGWAGMGRVADTVSSVQKQYQNLYQNFKDFSKDVITGMKAEIGGRMIGAGATKALGVGGKVIRQASGGLTGTGSAAIENGLKASLRKSSDYIDAVRGKISAEKISDSVVELLKKVKIDRGKVYGEQLKTLAEKRGMINPQPILESFNKLLKGFHMEVSSTGEIVRSQGMAAELNDSGQRTAKKIMNSIVEFVHDRDFSATRLDNLKKAVGAFFERDDKGHSAKLVTAMENTIKNTISKEMPEYGEMTKGYSDATTLINDIQSSFTGKAKYGIPKGLYAADKTFSRLLTAMRKDPEMTRDILRASGPEGQRIIDQVTGNVMSPWLSRRPLFASVEAAGLITKPYLLLSPKVLTLLAATSPRIGGEFMWMYGKHLADHGVADVMGRAMGYGIEATNENKEVNVDQHLQDLGIGR